MKAGDPWPILAFRNHAGAWEEGPFDPSNIEHVAMMMALTADCPECQRWLESVLPGNRPRRQPHRCDPSDSRRQRNRRRRRRQALGAHGR